MMGLGRRAYIRCSHDCPGSVCGDACFPSLATDRLGVLEGLRGGPVLTGDGHLVLESVAANGHNEDTNRGFWGVAGYEIGNEVC